METRVLTLFDDEEFFPKEPPKEKPKKEKASKEPANNTAEDIAIVKNELDTNDAGNQESGPSIFSEEDMPAISFQSERLVDDKIPENEAAVASFIMEQEEPSEIVHKLPEEEPKLMVAPEDVLDNFERLVDDKIPENEAVMISDDAVSREGSETIPEASNEEPELLSMPEEEAAIVVETPEDIIEVPTEEEKEAEEQAPIDEEIKDENKELNQQILSELIQLDYTALMQKDYTFDLNNATVINKELPKKKAEPVIEETEEEEDNEVFEEVTPLPEWNLDKKYYTIGEVAQLFTVNTSHIRFWTNEFKLKPRTTRKGDRLYSPKDIAELRLIHHLVKEKKHTIKGAREKLKAEKTGVNNKLDLKESLMQLKDTLLKIKEQL